MDLADGHGHSQVRGGSRPELMGRKTSHITSPTRHCYILPVLESTRILKFTLASKHVLHGLLHIWFRQHTPGTDDSL